jgi:hypothetical protein
MLRKHYVHPSADRLYHILRRARPKETDSGTRKILEDITNACRHCQMHQAQPRRFVVSASMTDAEHDFCFGGQVDMDLLWIQPRPVLHVVDHDTGFTAAYFVTGETMEHIWEAFLSCCSLIYDGMPKALLVDQGPYFVSQRWKSLCNENNVQ